jgi:hypothetical protein
MTAAFYGAQSDGVDDQPRLDARLDREQPTDFAQNCHH